MKLLQFILIAIFLLGGIASCEKLKGDENKEVTYSGGRVVLINSDTPVPNALVRFLKIEESTGIFDPMVYTEVGSDTTDVDGQFDIPQGIGASLARAYGLQSIFDQESQDMSLDNYWAAGGTLKLQLVPPAWIKVSVVDMEPLNPEVHFIEGSPNTGISLIQLTPLTDPQIWKVFGNTPQWISYREVYFDNTYNLLMDFDIAGPVPFDTTEIVIPY